MNKRRFAAISPLLVTDLSHSTDRGELRAFHLGKDTEFNSENYRKYLLKGLDKALLFVL